MPFRDLVVASPLEYAHDSVPVRPFFQTSRDLPFKTKRAIMFLNLTQFLFLRWTEPSLLQESGCNGMGLFFCPIALC